MVAVDLETGSATVGGPDQHKAVVVESAGAVVDLAVGGADASLPEVHTDHAESQILQEEEAVAPSSSVLHTDHSELQLPAAAWQGAESKNACQGVSTTSTEVAAEKSWVTRRLQLGVLFVSSLLCVCGLSAFIFSEFASDATGPTDEGDDAPEVVVRTSGHDVHDGDVHVVLGRMREGEKNLTLNVLDAEADVNFTLGMHVKHFDPIMPDVGEMALLINVETGGFVVGNTTIKALVCTSNGTVPTGCRFETRLPRMLLDNNTADVIKHTVTTVVVAAVIITLSVVNPGLLVPEMVGAATPIIVAGCFPGRAMVQAVGGARMIRSISIGTMMLTSQGFAPMYLSGHQDPVALTSMIQLTTASNHTLTLTPDHYLPLPGGSHKSAGCIEVGDELFVKMATGFVPSLVTSVSTAEEIGLYNPYTTTGDLVVDGVLASCHSSWFLEGLVSEARIVPIYQWLLAPVRLLYAAFPAWLERFTAEFLNDPKALSETGAVHIATTAVRTLFA